MLDCGPVLELEESKEGKASGGGGGGCISATMMTGRESMTAASLTVFQNSLGGVVGVVSLDHAKTQMKVIVVKDHIECSKIGA